MAYRPISASLVLALAACSTPAAPPEPLPGTRPLEVLQPGFDPALARSDLIATARERYGTTAAERALASPTYLFAKRFVGMPPPPPPGAGPDWRAPTPSALLIRENGRWLAATEGGWRPAAPEAAAEIEQLLADPAFWSEPAFTPACPDFGAMLLLLKVPGRKETVRNSQCTGRAERLVSAALRA